MSQLSDTDVLAGEVTGTAIPASFGAEARAAETDATVAPVLPGLAFGAAEAPAGVGSQALVGARLVAGIGLPLCGPTGHAVRPVSDPRQPRTAHALPPIPGKGGAAARITPASRSPARSSKRVRRRA